jgi:hypothetical protein
MTPMRRAMSSLFFLNLMILQGCALPALPRLPALPALPRLPALPSFHWPTPPAAADVVPGYTKGETLKEAYALAKPVADGWASDAVLFNVVGLRLDGGGREAGHPDGEWLLSYQSQTHQLKVTIAGGAASGIPGGAVSSGDKPLGGDLGGLLDSPEAIAQSGLKGTSFTMVLHQADSGPIYDLVADVSLFRASLDARTGQKQTPQ